MNTFKNALLATVLVAGTAFGTAMIQPAQAAAFGSSGPAQVQPAVIDQCRRQLIKCLQDDDNSVPYCEAMYAVCEIL